MKKTFYALCGTALPLLATPAFSGGWDRDILDLSIFYEHGTVHRTHYTMTNSAIEGEVASAPTNEAGTSYTTYGYGFKADMSTKFSHAFIIDRPYGNDIDYYDADPATGVARAKGKFASYRASYLMRYKLNDNVSLVGGIIGEEVKPAFVWMGTSHNKYTLRTNATQNFGYALGGIYENPEQSLRLSALYYSGVTHEMRSRERETIRNDYTLTTPKSLTLAAQKGITDDTSVSASVRWAGWSEFSYEPVDYVAEFGEPLINPSNDIITYNLGVAHKMNDKFSMFGGVSYEPATDGKVNILMPYDGQTSLNIGGQYTMPMGKGSAKISGNLTYTMLGDAEGDMMGTPFTFEDNSELGFGLSLTYAY